MTEIRDPLFGEPCEQIPLPSAPLVTVLSQIRFEEIVLISKEDYVAQFQERIRSLYPKFNKTLNHAVELTPHGVTPVSETIWRFASADSKWNVSLASTFMTLETREYSSREDFLRRFSTVLDVLATEIRPTHVSRIGIRYIDRVEIDKFSEVMDLVDPGFRGIPGADIKDGISYSISQIECQAKECKLMVKWGLLPPDATHSPNEMPASEKRAWFFDIDAFEDFGDNLMPYSSERVVSIVESMAARSYHFFRWATTPAFLKAFGARI